MRVKMGEISGNEGHKVVNSKGAFAYFFRRYWEIMRLVVIRCIGKSARVTKRFTKGLRDGSEVNWGPGERSILRRTSCWEKRGVFSK